MKAAPWVRITLTASAIVAAAGLVDTGRHDQWDAAVLFAGLLLSSIVLIVSTFAGRPAVPVRGDLARWLASTASTNGEHAGDVADRAIAAYRASLFPPGELVDRSRREEHHG